jgi:hypothetical protein
LFIPELLTAVANLELAILAAILDVEILVTVRAD